MTNSFLKWITKRMIKGVSGFQLDSFLLALEDWRRGLTLTWYYDSGEVTDMTHLGTDSLGKVSSLESSDKQKIHCFFGSRGNKVSNEAVSRSEERRVGK